MTRNRYKNKREKTLSLSAPQYEVDQPVPSIPDMVNWAANGESDDLLQKFIQVLTDSASLADEPEFTDFPLDHKKVFKTFERWLIKYKNRLEAAQKKGFTQFEELFDEMRLKVVDELATPVFYKEVDNRLETMLERVKSDNDLKKIEMILMIKTILQKKQFPVGLCGLIMEIVNRKLNQTLQTYHEEQELYDLVSETIAETGEDPLKMIDDPEKLNEIEQKLSAARPELRQLAEKQAWDMVDAFEDQLLEGKIKLDLFSDEELILPFQQLEKKYGKPLLEIDDADEEMPGQIIDAITQTINDLMTPERFQRLRQDIESAAREWACERQEWAIVLRLELEYLAGEKYEDNKFVLATFLGQINRAGKEAKPARKHQKR
jgi:hypothetical protein